MPISSGMGYGVATHDKQDGLTSALQQHFCVTKAVIERYPGYAFRKYFYIDAYSGSGFNIEAKVMGSPLVFRNNVHLLGLPFTAIFIDDVEENIQTLKVIGWTDEYRFICADNHIAVPQVIDRIKQIIGTETAYGLIYCDPNGLPDVDMLKYVSKKLSKIDILIRMNVGAGKRQVTKIRIKDVITQLNKSNWIVRGPLENDPAQWSFLFGTNYIKFAGWKSRGFHRIDSYEGKRIFSNLNYTKEEKKAMSITKGVYCGKIESERLDFS